MSDAQHEIILEGKKFLSLKKSTELSNYHSDYLGRLARSGKLEGRLVGLKWFIEEKALNKFIAAKNILPARQQGGSDSRPEIITARQINDSWDRELFGNAPKQNRFSLYYYKYATYAVSGIFLIAVLVYATPFVSDVSRQVGKIAESSTSRILGFYQSAKGSALSGVAQLSLPSLPEISLPRIALPKITLPNITFLKLPDLPKLPFSFSDAQDSISDIKNKIVSRFGNNLFAWS